MNKGVVYFSCDPLYYENHGRALVDSCLKYGENVIVNIDTPTHYVDVDVMEEGVVFTNTNFVAEYPNAQKRTVWASSRFLHMPKHNHSGMLILDADCFLRKPIDWSDFDGVDYSLFLRDPLPGTVGLEKEGSRVAAGAVYVKRVFQDFFASNLKNILNANLNHYSNAWFIDQLSLYDLYKNVFDEYEHRTNSFFNFKQMPQKYIDWEFTPDSTVWTGKGNRKTQGNYLNERSRNT